MKLIFDLNPKDKQGFEVETIWAESIGGKQFRLLNSPFFVFGISAQDIVTATKRESAYIFESVCKQGGHSTYRIFLQGGNKIDGKVFQSRWKRMRALGATFENANDRLVSVDIPPSGNVKEIYELLEKGESDHVWSFEEGNYEKVPIVEEPTKEVPPN